MVRFRWRGVRLPVALSLSALSLSLLLTAGIVLVSGLLMTPGLVRDLVVNCAPNIGDLVIALLLLLLPPIVRRTQRPDEGEGLADQNKSTGSHDD